MPLVTHLKALQAIDLAVRKGSFKDAAEQLGITPAAVGQRIRALEDYLGTDLILRGRSGLQPTAELRPALADLHQAFDALERASDALDFQRASEIYVVADPDWAELWLAPRLPNFRATFPNVLFCINGTGDVPLRLGAPDLRVVNSDGAGTALFRDLLLPVTGPDNPRRIAGYDRANQMEGMPLLHLETQRENADRPGWVEWFERFGHRASGPDRGVHYKNARLALEAVRSNVGFLLCGLSLVLDGLDDETIVTPFPASDHLVAPHPYRLSIRDDGEKRPQIRKFADWLRDEARQTEARIERFRTG